MAVDDAAVRSLYAGMADAWLESRPGPGDTLDEVDALDQMIQSDDPTTVRRGFDQMADDWLAVLAEFPDLVADDSEAEVAHLPGKHDQKSHAHGGGGPAVSAATDHDALMQDMLGGEPPMDWGSPARGETRTVPSQPPDAKPIGQRDLGWGPVDVYAPSVMTEHRPEDDKTGGLHNERTYGPPKYVYRSVTEADYQRLVDKGQLDTDARGTIETGRYMNGGYDPSTAYSYLPSKGSAYDDGSGAGRVLRIDYDPADGWFAAPSVDGYLRTESPIPAERISLVSGKIVRDDQARLVGITAALAHLTGKHDQKSHAHGGSGLPGGFSQGEPYDEHPDVDVYRKGMVEVLVQRDSAFSTEDRDRLLRTTGRLADKYPEHVVTYVVHEQPAGTFQTAEGKRVAYGLTQATPDGRKMVYIDPNLSSPEGQRQFQGQVTAGAFQPSARDVPAVTYVATHEWGHTMQPDERPRGREFATRDATKRATAASGQTGPLVGRYAARAGWGYEPFAESFAEFTLTNGRTDDAFIRALAVDQGWEP